MFSILFIGSVLVLSILDLFLLVQVSNGVGIWMVAISQLATGVFGFVKMKKMDFNLFFYIDAEQKKGEMIIREIWEEAFILTAACLLILPGFISDIIAALCFVPDVRKFCLNFLDNS